MPCSALPLQYSLMLKKDPATGNFTAQAHLPVGEGLGQGCVAGERRSPRVSTVCPWRGRHGRGVLGVHKCTRGMVAGAQMQGTRAGSWRGTKGLARAWA